MVYSLYQVRNWHLCFDATKLAPQYIGWHGQSILTLGQFISQHGVGQELIFMDLWSFNFLHEVYSTIFETEIAFLIKEFMRTLHLFPLGPIDLQYSLSELVL